jgi:hypothetical protein
LAARFTHFERSAQRDSALFGLKRDSEYLAIITHDDDFTAISLETHIRGEFGDDP